MLTHILTCTYTCTNPAQMWEGHVSFISEQLRATPAGTSMVNWVKRIDVFEFFFFAKNPPSLVDYFIFAFLHSLTQLTRSTHSLTHTLTHAFHSTQHTQAERLLELLVSLCREAHACGLGTLFTYKSWLTGSTALNAEIGDLRDIAEYATK